MANEFWNAINIAKEFTGEQQDGSREKELIAAMDAVTEYRSKSKILTLLQRFLLEGQVGSAVLRALKVVAEICNKMHIFDQVNLLLLAREHYTLTFNDLLVLGLGYLPKKNPEDDEEDNEDFDDRVFFNTKSASMREAAAILTGTDQNVLRHLDIPEENRQLVADDMISLVNKQEQIADEKRASRERRDEKAAQKRLQDKNDGERMAAIVAARKHKQQQEEKPSSSASTATLRAISNEDDGENKAKSGRSATAAG